MGTNQTRILRTLHALLIAGCLSADPTHMAGAEPPVPPPTADQDATLLSILQANKSRPSPVPFASPKSASKYLTIDPKEFRPEEPPMPLAKPNQDAKLLAQAAQPQSSPEPSASPNELA